MYARADRLCTVILKCVNTPSQFLNSPVISFEECTRLIDK